MSYSAVASFYTDGFNDGLVQNKRHPIVQDVMLRKHYNDGYDDGAIQGIMLGIVIIDLNERQRE